MEKTQIYTGAIHPFLLSVATYMNILPAGTSPSKTDFQSLRTH